MPIFLINLLSNKYVVSSIAALCLFGYIKWLHTSLSEARKEAQGYAAIAQDQTALLEARNKAYDMERKAIEQLHKQKNAIAAKSEQRAKQIEKLEKAYVVKDGTCQLDDLSFGLLDDSYKEANSSDATK